VHEPANGTPVARFGAFEVNFVAGELRKHGIRLKVQEQPFQVLVLLLERPGELITREEIQQKLWPSGTFVDFDNGLNTAINRLREALGDSAENPRFVVTEPRRGYRFIAPVNGHLGLKLDSRSLLEKLPVIASRFKWSVIASVVTVAMLATGGFFYAHRAPRPAGSHSIIVADFTNTTGDPVFDGTLRQGLTVQLEQSPFLEIISDDRIQQTLSLMEQAPTARLTADLAMQVCQRVGAAAVLDGSVANLGGEYIIGLRARDCQTGKTAGQTQATANEKSKVLGVLGKAGTQIRGRLGETLASIQEYDTPLEDVTTSSLEALQAYSLGVKANRAGDIPPAISFLMRAISLDPNFAMAYAMLGVVHASSGGQDTPGVRGLNKAYELRARVSEKERLQIETDYYVYVIGDLEKALRTSQEWAQTYPRDEKPHFRAAVAYDGLGQYENSLAEWLEASRLAPGTTQHYGHLAAAYLSVGRLREAKEVAHKGAERMPHFRGVHHTLYLVAFLEGDEAGMAEQIAWAEGNPRFEEWMLGLESDTAAFFGKVAEADKLMQHAMISAELAGEKGMAAGIETKKALRAALFGNTPEVKRAARASMQRSGGVEVPVAIALALSGDASQARRLADDFAKHPTEDTLMEFCGLPKIRASIALSRGDPRKAIAELEPTTAYERTDMFIVYLRGIAYLAAHQGSAAAVEFDKILARPYLVLNDTIGALAHLGLARANALQGNNEASRKAYQDYFNLWRDADPDIPILIAAKSEFAKLH
jgi:eukaryotic-like serine/threonine-protein kinase